MLRIFRHIRPPSVYPAIILPLALIASCLIQAALTGCTAGGTTGRVSKGISGESYGEASSEPSSQSRPESTTQPQGTQGSGLLPAAASLDQHLPGLRQAAGELGLVADYVLPDENSASGFLIVAPDASSARALNGYFYWLSDQPSSGQAETSLLLGLDKLFTEKARKKAISSEQFTERCIVGLLEFSMQQILSSAYQPAMLEFVLTCYRQDFAWRLANPGSAADQTWSKSFDGIEAVYNASIFSSVLFKVA